MDARVIAKVNKVNIIVAEENTKDSKKRLVPIEPLCDAIGVKFQSQVELIKQDGILQTTIMSVAVTTNDKKTTEMVSLPLKFIFGWIFMINTPNIKYKLECYNVLYQYFSEYAEYVEIRGRAIEKQWQTYSNLQKSFKDTGANMREAKTKLQSAQAYTFEKYKENKDQFKLEFLEDEE